MAACPVPSSPLGAPQTLRSALCHDTSLQWVFQGTEGQQNKGADSGDMSAAIPGAGAWRHHLRTKSVPWGRISGVSGLPGSASPCCSQSRSSHSSDFKTELLKTHKFLSMWLKLSHTWRWSWRHLVRMGAEGCSLVSQSSKGTASSRSALRSPRLTVAVSLG